MSAMSAMCTTTLLLLSWILGAEAQAIPLPQSCIRCHGAGQSAVASLEGQHQEYLEKQLKDYRSRLRIHSKMNDITQGMSDPQIEFFAGYFSKLPPKKNDDLARLIPERIQQGERIANAMNCAVCHGADYKGFGITPSIRGMRRSYIASQLKDYRDRRRTNESGVMFSVVQFLEDSDIDLLTEFLGSLP